MHDFGKLTMKIETVEVEGQSPVRICVFYDASGVEWHELFRSTPAFDYYVALDNKDRVVSAEPDPEYSQIEGHRILGLSADEFGDHTRGPGGTVYGKHWNGSAIVAPVLDRSEYPTLTPRQLWLTAATINITKEQILLMVDQMEDKAEADALRIELTETVNFERTDPAVDRLAELMGVPGDQLDSLWLWAAGV